jgi:hypothetical protein
MPDALEHFPVKLMRFTVNNASKTKGGVASTRVENGSKHLAGCSHAACKWTKRDTRRMILPDFFRFNLLYSREIPHAEYTGRFYVEEGCICKNSFP